MAVSDHSNLPPSENAADRALVDYLDGLLHDSSDYANASLDIFSADALRETPPIESLPTTLLPTAPQSTGKVTPLPTVKRAPRLVEALKNLPEARPFAEPVRSLPLRMPPLAAPVQAAAPEVVIAESPSAECAPKAATETTTETPVETVAEAIAMPTRSEVDPLAAPTVSAEAVPQDELAAAEAAQQERLVWAANGRPQWAQGPFECLIFTAGGLTLAVPLVELGSIYPLEQDDLTEIFGQIDWFMGLIRTAYGNVRVIDTAQVVMPERYAPAMAEGYRYVVTLNNSDWGLGVDALAGTTLLNPDAVRWRSERSKRPWLAGTVIEKMCALLDPAQLNIMFNQMDRKRRK